MSNREDVVEAAKTLAQARVRFANAYLLNKQPQHGVPVSDRTAEQMAVAQTEDEITVLKTKLDMMMKGYNK